MDGFIRLIEAEVHNALQHARVIGMIHVERDAHDDYIEDSYIVAWQRDNRGGHRGEGENWGTHRAQVNNKGEVMLVIGHYDIPSREAALSHMLERAKVVALAVPEGHSLITDKDSNLALWFTPDAIKQHFMDGDEDDPLVKWVAGATKEQLYAVGEGCIGADPLYREFGRLLRTEVQWQIDNE